MNKEVRKRQKAKILGEILVLSEVNNHLGMIFLNTLWKEGVVPIYYKIKKVRMASKGNATTKSSSKPSDPSTASCTPNTVEKYEEIEESQEQTNSADPSVFPRTSRHTSKAWDNFTRKRPNVSQKEAIWAGSGTLTSSNEFPNYSRKLTGDVIWLITHEKKGWNRSPHAYGKPISYVWKQFGSVSMQLDSAPPLTYNTKQHTHWCSYTNVNAPEEIKARLNDAQLKMFRDSPFVLFLNLPKLKVQPQLLRSLMYAETDHDNMFIIKNTKQHTHWCSYTNLNAPEEIKVHLNDAQFKMFRDSPFVLFLNLPKLKVQPQLL
ncbi:hypothetical protein RND71_021552 [Anisodus tanguticus]|uniref:Uncharacterized protein n=1 Tax=Anisodus tanguticus TaxID=243964 RepID=A0AAE1RWR0_9SOLA|nr:hypothetical protein RND71_021552 [Anisodus tanguticus]